MRKWSLDSYHSQLRVRPPKAPSWIPFRPPAASVDKTFHRCCCHSCMRRRSLQSMATVVSVLIAAHALLAIIFIAVTVSEISLLRRIKARELIPFEDTEASDARSRTRPRRSRRLASGGSRTLGSMRCFGSTSPSSHCCSWCRRGRRRGHRGRRTPSWIGWPVVPLVARTRFFCEVPGPTLHRRHDG